MTSLHPSGSFDSLSGFGTLSAAMPQADDVLNAGRMCRRPAIALDGAESIAAAARLMRERHVGYLVVTQSSDGPIHKVVGILTDRDIVVAVVARGADPDSLKVSDVMSRNPLLMGEEHSLESVLCFMRDAGVRRVPVVGQRGELVGVLSVDDVLKRLAQQLTHVAETIFHQRQTEQLLRP